MDESLQELENELRRLTPRRLSPKLNASLERELGGEPRLELSEAGVPRRHATVTMLRSWKWAGWSLVGAAAIAAIAMTVQLARSPLPSSDDASQLVSRPPAVAPVTTEPRPDRYEPVRAESVLYALKEDGAAKLADNTEGRQVRYRYVDTYTWRNPKTNASVRWSVPRDEVRLVRASLD